MTAVLEFLENTQEWTAKSCAAQALSLILASSPTSAYASVLPTIYKGDISS
jgi:hypothetical protein